MDNNRTTYTYWQTEVIPLRLPANPVNIGTHGEENYWNLAWKHEIWTQGTEIVDAVTSVEVGPLKCLRIRYCVDKILHFDEEIWSTTLTVLVLLQLYYNGYMEIPKRFSKRTSGTTIQLKISGFIPLWIYHIWPSSKPEVLRNMQTASVFMAFSSTEKYFNPANFRYKLKTITMYPCYWKWESWYVWKLRTNEYYETKIHRN